MASLRQTRIALLWLLLATCGWISRVSGAESASEYQVKAVFVFNFAHFVEWPLPALGSANQAFVIGILGTDPFGSRIDEAVRGEQINQHPLTIRRFHDISEVRDCQILYIDRSQSAQLRQILAALDHRGTLTVSDMENSAQQGVMIQFLTENSHIRLRINNESARAAGLTISSKLLRPAELVGSDARE